MKNLKKVLSLVLAAAMAMSLMATSAFAKDDAYADADKVSFNEAVDVMSAIGVFQGSNGQFNPTGDLTRESAAKIITYMLMGKDNADQLKAGSAPYADVAADRWSAGAISYCTAQGIIAGSNGKFMPTEKVTGVQFAKMLLVALGYDAKIEKMVGPSWAIYTSTLAVSADLNAEMENVLLSAPLTREQAAMMAFNTLKADVVKYANKGTEITLADGTSIMMGATPAEKQDTVSAANNYAGSASDAIGQGSDQFIEKYFKDVRVTVGGKDAMGRPANVWSMDKGATEIGSYGNAADYTFVATEKDGDNQTLEALVKDFNKNLKFADAGLTITSLAESGATTPAKSAAVNAGATVELYMNDSGKIETVVIADYTVHELAADVATKVKDDTDYISVPGVTKGYVKAETVNGAAGLVDGDVVLVTADKDKNLYIKKAASVKGVVSGHHSTKGVSVNGTFYDLSPAGADSELTEWSDDYKNTYTFYLNDANQVVKAVKETAEASGNYAVVEDVVWVTGSGINGTNYVEAKIVKPDATTEIVKIASVDGFKPVIGGTEYNFDGKYYKADTTKANVTVANSTTAGGATDAVANDNWFMATTTNDGKGSIVAQYFGIDTSNATKANASAKKFVDTKVFYSYEIDKDGKYELSSAPAGKDTFKAVKNEINPKNPDVGATANDKTIFVYATKDGDDIVYTAYTGIKNAPKATNVTITGKQVVTDEAGFATLVFVDLVTNPAAAVEGAFDKDLVYISDASDYTTMKNGDKTYYVYNAIVNGEAKEVKLETTKDGKDDSPIAAGMYTVKTANADGYLTLTSELDTAVAKHTGIKLVGGGAFVVGDGTTYSYDDKTVAYFINEDGESTQMAVDALSKDATDLVWVVKDEQYAEKIYVVEAGQEPTAIALGAAGDRQVTIANNNVKAGTAAITGWKAGETDKVKIDVTEIAGTTVTMTLNGTEVEDGTAFVIPAAGDYELVVTIKDTLSDLESVFTYKFTVAAAPNTADVAFALTTPVDNDGTNDVVVDQTAKTVAVNVASGTTTVKLTAANTAAQTISENVEHGKVTVSAAAANQTVTVATLSNGTTETFTLKVDETAKTPITYTVTVTVAPAAP